MNVVVSIENATTYTPILKNVTLNNASWVDTQQLDDGQSIASNKRVVGMLDAALPFSGSILVHYVFLAPGPNGADVIFTFDGQGVSDTPLVGCGWRSQPTTAFPNSSAQPQQQGSDYYLFLRVK